MHRGSRRQLIFEDDQDRRRFLHRLGATVERSGVVLHAFALMPNHYHLLVECPEGGLSQAMKLLNASYAQEFNWRHGYDGHLFRGRFRSLLIENDAYLVEVARYIHRNSMSASLVQQPLLDPWCSHQFYIQGGAPSWLETERVLTYFRGNSATFAEFVDAENSSAARAVIEAIDQKRPAIGSRAFLQRLRPDAPPDGETKASAARLLPIDLNALEHWCETCVKAADVPAWMRTADLCMAVGRHLGVPLPVLAQRFGFVSAESVRTRIRRLNQRAQVEPEIARVLQEATTRSRLDAVA